MALMKSSPSSGFLPLFFIVFLDMIGVGLVIPIFAPLLLDGHYGLLPGTYSLAFRTILLGLLVATFPLAQFFGAPFLGALSDRWGRKKVLLISLAGTLAGYLLLAAGILLQNLYLVFLSRIVDGFTGGNISTVLSAIADQSDESSKAKNFGMIGMAFGLGFIIGPFLGGKLADPSIISWFDYATPFFFAAVLTLLNICFVWLRFRETLKTPLHHSLSFLTGFQNIQKAFQMQHLRIAFVVVFLLTFGFSFFTQFFQVFLIHKFSFTQSRIGDLFAYIGFWIAFSQGVVARKVSQRFLPQQILPYALFFLACSFLAILVPSKAIWLLAVMPFLSIFQGLTYPNTTALISNLSGPQSQGEILGINQSLQALGQVFPPIIAGFIVSLHYSLPLVVASICTFFAWIIFLIFFTRKKEEAFQES